MISRVIILWLTIFCMAAASGAAAVQTQPAPAPLPRGFNPGEAFPTKALPSADGGRPISLAEFRGKKVIVNVFASW